MKNASEIYAEYRLMPNLKQHQFRVAAVAEIICKNLSEVVDKDNIILACLYHDMGNIIKFDYFYVVWNRKKIKNKFQLESQT